jgi:hypothetical protein
MTNAEILALSLLVSTTSILAQPREALGREEVVELSGVTSGELFLRARSWFADSFVDSKNVLEIADKEAGMLVGKGTSRYEPNVLGGSTGLRGHIRFVVKVLVKEGRYKYSISDFVHTGSSGGMYNMDCGSITADPEPPEILCGTRGTKGWKAKLWPHLQQECRRTVDRLSESLKAHMTKASESSGDW